MDDGIKALEETKSQQFIHQYNLIAMQIHSLSHGLLEFRSKTNQPRRPEKLYYLWALATVGVLEPAFNWTWTVVKLAHERLRLARRRRRIGGEYLYNRTRLFQ